MRRTSTPALITFLPLTQVRSSIPENELPTPVLTRPLFKEVRPATEIA